MKKTTLFTLILILSVEFISAQVLFTENFDTYPVGDLNTDYTGTTVGQGGWLVSRYSNGSDTALVTTETGKGKALTIKTNTNTSSGINIKQAQGVINNLWNNRSAGHDILKFEYEFHGSGIYHAVGGISSQGSVLANALFFPGQNRISVGYWHTNNISAQNTVKFYNSTNFPHNMWIKVEIFIDYNTKTNHFYIPTLNYYNSFPFTHNRTPDNLEFDTRYSAVHEVKFDNIKLSALPSLPSYLSSSEHLAAKFNLYPNPATDIVTITNSEKLFVKQTEIYDLAGKVISTQSFNSEAEVQLNVADLASGTYMLYLETNQGTAVKKFIKK
ncbi:T9SS type A sorting domain-containing protein [Paenimyroides baculatum]|uniref:T9SS type A sorting domain-containing protein n=1 Tax=Paenimyroides baculatum TaxID=2608000 RepID=A0A5M6CRR4_9FLAO|nr:T9SS type A sorting domain-containing protein [Paenimyroides baculatum]KAA5537877.1 T9SS type A sorting domain-containing protein [Paenimyroides baculatum]